MTIEIKVSTAEAHAVMETRPANQPLSACSRLHTAPRVLRTPRSQTASGSGSGSGPGSASASGSGQPCGPGTRGSRSRARVRGAWVPAAHHAERSETPGASRERGAHRGVGRYPRRARQADVLNRAEVESQPANREQEGAEGAERRGVAAQLVGRLVPRAEPAGSRPDDLGGKQGHDTFLARGTGR